MRKMIVGLLVLGLCLVMGTSASALWVENVPGVYEFTEVDTSATASTGTVRLFATGDTVYIIDESGNKSAVARLARDETVTGNYTFEGTFAVSSSSVNITGTTVKIVGETKMVNTYFGTVSAGTDDERSVFVAPYDCELTLTTIVNASDIATDAVSFTTISLRDKGSDGSADNQIAAISTDTTAISAFDGTSLGTLDATHKLLTSGDIVSLKKVDTAGGDAFDELMIMISYKRR